MRSSLISIALAGVLLTATGLSAQSQPSYSADHGPTGLIVGANFTGSFVTVGDAAVDEHGFGGRGRESGAGMHFTLGYGFTPTIAVLLHGGGVMLSEDEERVIGGVDLALRYSFAAPARTVVPYLEMAVGGGALEDGVDGGRSESTGGSLSGAAGLNVFFTRRFAFNADLRYNLGTFTSISRAGRSTADDASIAFDASRLNVGFNWYPMAGR